MIDVAIAVFLYIAFIVVLIRFVRANGDDTDAQEAADSVRAALESDDRLDELRTYTHPRIKAGTAYGKELT